MSHDTHMLLRTPLSAAEVRAALTHDPALADLKLVDYGDRVGMGSDLVGLDVTPWVEDDHDLIEDGFETADVRVMLFPRRGEAGWDAYYRTFAAILRLVPGDVCLADQDAAGPGLLRLSGVVYVDPGWVNPKNLTDFGYTPDRLVIGIPSQTAEAAAE